MMDRTRISQLVFEKIPAYVFEISERLKSHGFESYIVGGWIRNISLHLDETDIDMTTNATIDDIKTIFPTRWRPRGEDNGCLLILSEDNKYFVDLATYRSDTSRLKSGSGILVDLSTRDFTINSMAISPLTGELYGPGVDGDVSPSLNDIRDKVIRFVGNPYDRITEDPLRILRAIRFSASLNFFLSKETRAALLWNSNLISNISKERISSELIKSLRSDNPVVALSLWRELGIMMYSGLSEVADMYDDIKTGLWVHNLHAIDCVNDIGVCDVGIIRLGVLLNRIGSVSATSHNDVDLLSEEIAGRICKRLKMSNMDSDTICAIVLEVGSMPTKRSPESSIRKWWDFILRMYKNKHIVEILLEARAAVNLKSPDSLRDNKRITSVIAEVKKRRLNELAVNGNDIMSELGLRPGEGIGKILKHLKELVLENPNLNNRTALINISKALIKSDDVY